MIANLVLFISASKIKSNFLYTAWLEVSLDNHALKCCSLKKRTNNCNLQVVVIQCTSCTGLPCTRR